MVIQINTDNNISVDEEMTATFNSVISKGLNRFSGQITRVEVHFSDENSHKSGQNDKRCLLEVRLENLNPVAVNHQADSPGQALRGALDKLKASLDSTLGRLRTH